MKPVELRRSELQVWLNEGDRTWPLGWVRMAIEAPNMRAELRIHEDDIQTLITALKSALEALA